MKKVFLFGILLLINFTVLAQNSTGEIKVSMIGFRNNDGVVKVVLFKTKDGFPDESEKAYKRIKTKIENKKTEAIFKDVPYGIYAVAIFHDENSNEKMDENWMGIPIEGYGSSNNVKSAFSAPKFDDAKFKLDADSLPIEIKIQY